MKTKKSLSLPLILISRRILKRKFYLLVLFFVWLFTGALAQKSTMSYDASFVPTESWRSQRHSELTDSLLLFSRGGPKIYRDEYQDAIRLPVGGVGTGAIHMDGQARRAAWQLWRLLA